MQTKISIQKITTILLLLTIVFASSCKKDKISSSGYNSLSFKVDGVAQDFTIVSGSNDGSSYIQVKGSKTADVTTNELEFYFYTDGPIVDGDTYYYGSVVYNIKYYDAAGVLYTITAGEVTFTDETTSHVKGTFFGTVKNGSTTKTITDGSFELNL